ncbi:sorting nexin-19 [Patella vulgata]|uniref:sorting nexin-19 n=1 Tax=Patella vulgata TaxID=6465 RepID=UPI00217F9858|nr:sorting nexin-19 [Patella vulgata]
MAGKNIVNKCLGTIMEFFCWSKFTAIQKILCVGVSIFMCASVIGYWFSFVIFCASIFLSNIIVSYFVKRITPIQSEYLLYFVRSVNSVCQLFQVTEFIKSDKKSHSSDDHSNECKIDRELEILIDLIQHDFIKSWYVHFSDEEQVINESRILFYEASQNLKRRIKHLKREICAKQIIDLYRKHITSYQVAKWTFNSLKEPKIRTGSLTSQGKKVSRPSSIEEAYQLQFHPALTDQQSEENYLQNVIKLLMCKLFPQNFTFCLSAQILINEILLANIFKVLINKFSAPDFLFWCIIKITSNELDQVESATKSEILVDHQKKEINKKEESEFSEIVSDQNDLKEDNQTNDYIIPLTPLKPSRSTIPIVTIEGADNFEETVCEAAHSDIGDTQALNQNIYTDWKPKSILYDDDNISQCSDLSARSDTDTFHDIESDDMSSQYDIIETVSDNNAKVTTKNNVLSDNNKTEVHKVDTSITDTTLPSSDENKENLTNDTTPVLSDSSLIFQDVSITDTETATEFRSQNSYTLYIVQFEAMYFSDKGPVLRSGTTKRRFREFVNLNSRLDNNSYYKDLLKVVKGPKRWLNLPFKNMDKESVESRKAFLNQFLKSLIEIEAICNGPELREFLAYEGDSHIAFVKKSSEISVPRIDKMLVRTVSGMFDKIKSLPSLSQDVISGIVRRETSVDRKLEEKSPEIDKIDLEFDHQESPYPHHLDKYIDFCDIADVFMETGNETGQGKDKASELQEDILSLLPRLQGDGSESPSEPWEKDHSEVTMCPPLAESVLDLAVQIFTGRDLWFSRHRVLTVLKVTIGRALDRFIQDEICDLTSEDQWQLYISLIRETIWPDGKLSDDQPPIKTENEKEATKEMAKKCLTEFFPGWLRGFVGLEEMDYGVDEVIKSLQHEKLNKHFLFSMLDFAVEELFPEVSSQELQSILLSS